MPSSTSVFSQRHLGSCPHIHAFKSSADHREELLKVQQRSSSLQTFLADDAVHLMTTKKHLKLVNEIVGSVFMNDSEENPLNLWRCFGRTMPEVKKNLKRKRQESKPTSKFNTAAPVFIPRSGSCTGAPGTSKPSSPIGSDHKFNTAAPIFVPKSTSLPVTPTTSRPSTPSGSISPNPISGGFAFNIGTVNAPKQGFKTQKHYLDDDAFMITASKNSTPTGSPPRKIKIFSPEELKKQNSIVEEMKKKFINSL